MTNGVRVELHVGRDDFSRLISLLVHFDGMDPILGDIL
jgi:hypothetical protein